MSCTVVFYHDTPGESLTLILRDAAGAIANSGGTSLAEGAGLRYAASVSQALAGWYLAQIYDADDDIIYTGSVKVANDSGVYRIDDPAAEIPAAGPTANAIASAIWSAGQRTLTKFDFNVTAEVNPEELSGAIGEAMGDGISVAVASFTPAALAQLVGQRKIVVFDCGVVIGNRLKILQRDAYLDSLGSALKFSRIDFPDLTDGDSAYFCAALLPDSAVPPIEFEGEIVQPTDVKLLRFERTSAQTARWTPGHYRARVEVRFASGDIREFTGFELQVIKAIGANG